MDPQLSGAPLTDAALRDAIGLSDAVAIPAALRACFSTVLESPAPMQLWWGPDLIVFENDSCRLAYGSDISSVMAPRRASDIFGSAWPSIAGTAWRVMQTGVSGEVHRVALPRGTGRAPVSDTATLVLQPIVNAAGEHTAGLTAMLVLEPHALPRTAAVDAAHTDAAGAAISNMAFLLQSIPDGLVILDTEWRIGYANALAHEALEIPHGALLDRTPLEIFPALAGTAFETIGRTAMRERIGISVSVHHAAQGRWYEIWCAPASAGVIVFFRDVSARRAADSALRSNEARSDTLRRTYEAILTNTPDLAYVWDLDHRFVYANETLLRMWGATREQAIGRNCLELGYEPWHAEMHDREIDEIARSGTTIRGQVPFNGTFGRRIYDYILVPVFDAQGTVIAVAGTTRDVTDAREREEELRSLAARLSDSDRRKSEFLAILAHELRNPLAPLLNGLQIMQRGEADQTVRVSTASMMERQLTHMVRLVDDLLDLNRISRGTIELEREEVAVVNVLDMVAEAVWPTLRAAGQQLELIRPGDRILLDADRVRLVQVFTNLIVNASKFSPRGSDIDVVTAVLDDTVRVSVRDRGVGIPPDMLSSIFDMFTQVDRSRNREHGGLGIGLTLVKSVVELHGGTVEALSAGAGFGSEFVVTLPRSERARRLAESERRAADVATSPRVLVVDDNRDAAISLAVLLNLTGSVTSTAFDGEEALSVATDFDPDLVLLDIGLPKLNGYEVCRRLRARPRMRPVVIVALTGWGQAEDRRKSADAGFDAHLVKPLDPGVLQDTLSRFRESFTT